MRIEFCSLCDESVPLLDLDRGIAVKTKGRVVCAKCESAMSAEGASEDTSGSASSLEFLASEPAQPQPGSEDPQHAPSRSKARKRPRSSAPDGLLGGVLLGAFTLLVIGAVATGFHFYDQYELERAAAGAELRRLSEVVNQSSATQDRRMRAAVRSATSGLPATAAGLEQLKVELASLVESEQSSRAEVRADLDRILQRLVQVDLLIERLEANEADLGKVAASLADVFDEVLALQRRQDSFEAIAQAGDPMGEEPTALAQVQGAQPPAWVGQLPALEDPDAGTRWLAVTAIGEFQDPACGPHLTPRLKDEDVFVRMAAARILGEIKATSAIPDLIDALEDEQNTVRQAAMLALRVLTGESLKFDADAKPAQRAKYVKAWRDWWKKNQSSFIEAP